MVMTEEHKAKMAVGRARKRAEMARHSSVPLVETTEFKAAVAVAAREAAAAILAELTAARGGAPDSNGHPASAAPDFEWARGLAMAMAEVADQGSDRKRVAPEILAQRDRSAKLMRELLIEAKRSGDVPVYQLNNKVQLPYGDKGETIFEPIWMGNDKIHYPTEIEWNGVPNLAMIPINDVAAKIFAAFTASLGSVVIESDIDATLAMTPGGVVVRGGAAAALFRATGGRSELATPGGGREDVAGLRRSQPAQTKEIRVLGTIQAPATQNA